MTEHERVVEEVVSIFDALDTEASPFGSSQRDYVEEELKALSSEELVGQLRQAAHIVDAFFVAAEMVNPICLAALSDCRNRVRRAHAAIGA
jgi:hypothetical protein